MLRTATHDDDDASVEKSLSHGKVTLTGDRSGASYDWSGGLGSRDDGKAKQGGEQDAFHGGVAEQYVGKARFVFRFLRVSDDVIQALARNKPRERVWFRS